MAVKRRTINLTVSGNTLKASDSETPLAATDAGVQGEDGAVWLHCSVPQDWNGLDNRLSVIAANGAYDESCPAGNNDPIREIWSRSDVPNANSIAVDAEGNVYAAFYSKIGKTVQKLDADGNEIWSNSETPFAYGIAVDNVGNVYVAYHAGTGKTIRIFNSAGAELWSDSDVGYANGITVDKAGNFYVAYNRPDGKMVRKFSSSREELWSLSDAPYANGIAVDGAGNVYVAYYNAQGQGSGKVVRKLDPNGAELWNNADIPLATAIAVDGAGNVYAAYENGVFARKLDPNGNEIWRSTASLDADGIALDDAGNVCVASGNSAGLSFCLLDGRTGELKKGDSTVPYGSAVAAAGDGIVYEAYLNATGVTIRKMDTGSALTIDMPIRQGVLVPGRITVSLRGSDSTGIRKTADCGCLTVQASKSGDYQVENFYPREFDALRTQTAQSVNAAADLCETALDLIGSASEALKNRITSVTSANSDLTVANSGIAPILTLNSGTGPNQIVKLDADGKLPAVDGSALRNLSSYALPAATPDKLGGVKAGAGLSVAADGTLSVTAQGSLSGSSLKLLKTANVFSEIWRNSDVPNAGGITLDASGNIFVAYNNASGKTLRQFDVNGNELWSNSDVGNAVSAATDPAGNVYVAYYCATGKNLRKLSPEGVELWSKTDVGNPWSVAADTAGNVYVAYYNSTGKTVRKLDTNGNELWSSSDVPFGNCVAVDASGNVYAAYYNASGKTLRKFDAGGNELWSNSDVAKAYSVAVSADGTVFASYDNTSGKTVRAFTAGGKEIWSSADGIYAKAVCADAYGCCYAAYDRDDGTADLIKFEKGGVIAAKDAAAPRAYDIAVGGNGAVYVAYKSSSVTVRKLAGYETFEVI